MKKLLLLSCVVILFACKKDDTDPPVITLLWPTANSFNYQEQIPIRFTVTDNRKIEEVRVVIRSMSHQQVLQSLIFSSNKTSETFESSIRFDDVHVESGQYYIQVVASDGENEIAAIKSIQLYGAPLLLTAVYGFNSENNSTNIWRLTDGQWGSVFTVASKPFFSLADSYDQRLVFAGSSSQGLLATDAVTGVTIGQTSGINTQETLWQDAVYDDTQRWWWFACKDGSIRAYNTLAQLRNQFNVFANFLPTKITVSENYVIASVSNVPQTFHRIDTYLKETGHLVHSIQVDHKIDHLHALDDDHVWTFQSSEEMQQKVYVISSNYQDVWTNFRFATSGNLIKTIDIENRIAMLYEDGIRIYSDAGQLIASNSFAAENIFYEKLNNLIYAKASDSWMLFNGSLLTEEGTLIANSSVSELLFLYNK